MSDKQNNQEEKKMTKYDRKMEARKQQAAKEKRDRLRNTLITAAVVVLIVGAVLVTSLSSVFAKRAALKDTYIKIGEHELTELEYDFYYGYLVNSYLTQYASFLPYMGLDTSVAFDEQQYSEDMTWKDMFDQMTVEQIRQVKAAADDAAAKGWNYEEADEDYEAWVEGNEEEALDAGISIENYYKALFGNYATRENVEPFIREYHLATAYSEDLFESYRPTDETVKAYYEEHKDEYDLVDYYEAVFTAETEEDASEEDIEAAMAEQKELADAMKARLEAGEDFETLCAEYLPTDTEETEDTEEDADAEEEKKDAHLKEGYTSNYVSSLYSEWVFDESRKAGDVTVVEDTDNNRYYVVRFVERTYDEDCEEDISDQLANEALSDYLDELTEAYEVTDVKGDLVYLTLPEETEETETEEETE